LFNLFFLIKKLKLIFIRFKAQKPWAKLYVKVDKYKRDYHTATKNLKMAETQENNSKLDGAVPQDQVNRKRTCSLFQFFV
jgi:hypothetical protein